MGVFSQLDHDLMEIALEEARYASGRGEVPVGAVIVDHGGKVLGRGGNSPITLNDPSAHAEIQAIREAGKKVDNYRLSGCTMYVTLEPCVMCAGALRWAQLGRLVYGAPDDKQGFMQYGKLLLHPKTQVEYGVCLEECSGMLKAFFRQRRG